MPATADDIVTQVLAMLDRERDDGRETDPREAHEDCGFDAWVERQYADLVMHPLKPTKAA